MRRIIHATLMAATVAAPLAAIPAAAQDKQTRSAARTARGPFAPVVYVNNAAVTQYELDQRLRFMTLLRAPDANRDTALKALIDDRLKIEAARQLGVVVSDEGLDSGLAEFAGRANMDVPQFTEALARGGVERQAYRDFVKAGVAWREVVRQRIVPNVKVTEAELRQALRRTLETPITYAVALNELVIPAPPGREAQAEALAANIARSAGSEAQFAAAARKYSAVPSAPRGGRLPMTPLANLPPSLRSIVERLKPGQVTPPLTVQGAVVLFYMRDTQGRLRAGAAEQTIDYVVMPVANAADGNRILARARSCDEVFVEANRTGRGGQVQRQTESLGTVPSDVAQRIASLDDNEGSVFDYGAGARLVMLCRRAPTLIADALPPPPLAGGLPTPQVARPSRPDEMERLPGSGGLARPQQPSADNPPPPEQANAPAGSAPVTGPEAAPPQAADSGAAATEAAGAPTEPPLPGADTVREAIFNRKINAAADAYLAELRADAVIRRP